MNTNKPNAASAPAERKSAVVKTRPEDIVIWSNVVAQQQRARMRKALSTHSFPYPLFELLSHLAKDPGRKWSVTELAADFNTGQPGISKRLQNLLGRGLITVANDPDDKRRKWHWINSHGMRLLDKLESSFADECASLFEGWTTYEVEVLHSLLGRLKGTLEQRLSDES